MFKKLSIGLIPFLASTLLSSCTSSVFNHRLQPAAVPVTHNQWKVVLLNRFNADLLTYKKKGKLKSFRKEQPVHYREQ